MYTIYLINKSSNVLSYYLIISIFKVKTQYKKNKKYIIKFLQHSIFYIYFISNFKVFFYIIIYYFISNIHFIYFFYIYIIFSTYSFEFINYFNINIGVFSLPHIYVFICIVNRIFVMLCSGAQHTSSAHCGAIVFFN